MENQNLVVSSQNTEFSSPLHLLTTVCWLLNSSLILHFYFCLLIFLYYFVLRISLV